MSRSLVPLLIVVLFASGCTRRYLQFDYDYPARGLASRVQVERRNREPLNAAAPLQLTLHVNAPKDSALVLVVTDSARPADVIRALIASTRMAFSPADSAAVLQALPYADSIFVAPAIRIFTGTSRGQRRNVEIGERLRIAETVTSTQDPAKAGAVQRGSLLKGLCLRERRSNHLIPTTCTRSRVVVVPPGADSLVTMLFDVERGGSNQPHQDTYDMLITWLAYPVLSGVPTPTPPESESEKPIASLRWPVSTQCGRGQDAFCQEEHFVQHIRVSYLTGITRFAEFNFWYTPAIAVAAAGAVLIAAE